LQYNFCAKGDCFDLIGCNFLIFKVNETNEAQWRKAETILFPVLFHGFLCIARIIQADVGKS